MPDGGWEPAGCSLEDFNLVFLSLPFSSLSPTMFVHSCVHQRDYNTERGTFARTYVTDWVTLSTASIKSKMRSICTIYSLVGSTGCAAPDQDQSPG